MSQEAAHATSPELRRERGRLACRYRRPRYAAAVTCCGSGVEGVDVAWKFQTGTQWVHLPEKYGNWPGIYNRLRMWATGGTLEQVFTAQIAQADADEDLKWAVSVDCTIVRAHHHAAGVRKRGPGSRTRGPPHRKVPRRTDHKIHLAADDRWRPIAFVPHPGRPRTRPEIVLADKAYSSRALREPLQRRGIRTVIPVPTDQQGHRQRRRSRGGRPPAFDREAYKQRSAVERCINRLTVTTADSHGEGISSTRSICPSGPGRVRLACHQLRIA